MGLLIENFDARFLDYMGAWARKNREKYRNADEMEAAVPDVYTRWLNTPAQWLGGTTPGLYFAAYDDAAHLIAWMRAYLRQGVPLPDPLLERIGELGSGARGPLVDLLEEDGERELTMLALSLLAEIDAEAPIEQYLSLIVRHGGEGEVAIHACEALRKAGAGALPACLAAMEGAPSPVRLCLMDMLADFPGEEAVRRHALALLREGTNVALMAAYIARLGDEEALGELYRAAADPQSDYLTYVEIAGAIQALGGDPPEEREFSGDPAYESLKGMG